MLPDHGTARGLSVLTAYPLSELVLELKWKWSNSLIAFNLCGLDQEIPPPTSDRCLRLHV
jgi:hypothetical protein